MKSLLLKFAWTWWGTGQDWAAETVNASLGEGVVPSVLKEALVHSILKKASLDLGLQVSTTSNLSLQNDASGGDVSAGGSSGGS